jgi:hypothetical protein
MTREETWAKLVELGGARGEMPEGPWDLRRAKLVGANLSKADLSQANLSKADLFEANLSAANLSNADLSGANLFGADLLGANLLGADLVGAELVGVDLTASTLIGADLTKANLSRACIDYANLSDWIIKDVVCTRIVQRRTRTPKILSFAPQEFEKRYTQLERIAELILSIPLSDSISFVADAIGRSINHVKGSPVVSWKGVEALSDGDTRITYNVWDNDFWDHQKEIFETAFKDALNEYFEKNAPLKASDDYLDPIAGATDQIVEIRKEIDIPLTPFAVNTPALQKKAVDYVLRMGKIGQDILGIMYSIFR